METDDFVLACQKENNQYLENKTTRDIRHEIATSLDEFDKDEIPKYMNKLIDYRFVDEVDKLHIGKFTRWIALTDEQMALSHGGFLTNIDYGDKGVLLSIKSYGAKHFRLLFDQLLVYQKLSSGEKLILMAADFLEK
jgi:hypothetical protein